MKLITLILIVMVTIVGCSSNESDTVNASVNDISQDLTVNDNKTDLNNVTIINGSYVRQREVPEITPTIATKMERFVIVVDKLKKVNSFIVEANSTSCFTNDPATTINIGMHGFIYNETNQTTLTCDELYPVYNKLTLQWYDLVDEAKSLEKEIEPYLN